MPTENELLTLDYSYRGDVYTQIAPDATVDTKALDYSYQGEPFFAVAAATATNTSNFFLMF